ncbi:MAG TPA: TonB-dependent receptor [Chitinophagaceae bacterium]|nr:TonB-dependent receptor [Chitinophagaceae bacterium]
MKKILIFSLGFSFVFGLNAQRLGSLTGTVTDKNLLTPLNAVSVELVGTNKGTSTDSAGSFRLTGIAPRSYTIKFSSVGYAEVILYNIVVTSGNEINLSVQLEPAITRLEDVVIKSSRRTAVAASLETPLSVQRLTTEEIRSNPGGNFDISRVIQALPGVSGTAGSVGGYRNDIIIRGGAPNENVYYLDGIEIPVINHFATQGSAGGPTGILNVSFLEDVKLSSSAFDARFDNSLLSVFQFRQRNGNPNTFQGNVRLSATELAGTFEGPLSKKTTFLASARRSYLQLLFKAIDLPIRPNYWDFQYKVTHKLDKKTTLTLLGVGAIDDFTFAAPKDATPEKLYILDATAAIHQWNYTVGANLRRQIKNGYWNLSLSRNMFDNEIEKFDDNDEGNETKRRLGIFSQEIENKLRFDVNKSLAGWKIAYGAVAQYVKSNNNNYKRIRKQLTDQNGNVIQPELVIRYNSDISFWRYGAFAQVSKRYWDDRLGVSAGLRTDMNSFTNDGMNPVPAISPRISASYVLADKWTLNASIGSYAKLPTYTILSFRDNNGNLVNKDADYTRSLHYALGTEFLPNNTTRFTLEAFYKKYSNVPVSVRDGISLANLGGDFGAIGNEEVVTNGKGTTYGVEFFAQQKLTKRFFGTFSYTWFISRFSGTNGNEIASAWDNRHLLSFIWGYKFNKNWELGLKFRYQGGAPFTPFDMPASQLNYLTFGSGILDYNRLNTERLGAFHASDIRIDKKWNFRKITLDLFLDITNWYNAKSPAFPQYTFKRNADNTAFVTTDGQPIRQNGSNAIPFILTNDDASVIPTIGFIIEF